MKSGLNVCRGKRRTISSFCSGFDVYQVAADSAMDQITSALSEASARKNETERLKQDLAVNEKATQSRKGDIEEVHGKQFALRS